MLREIANLNAIHIVLLSWHYFRDGSPFREHTDDVKEAYKDLLDAELIKPGVEGSERKYTTTERGSVMVCRLLTTRIPVPDWK